MNVWADRAYRLLPRPAAAWVKAALGLSQLVPNLPVHPLQWLTPEPRWCSLTFCVPNHREELAAELYLPGDRRRHAGLVLSLGAADLGERDPRAVALSEMLARSGFAVMVVTGAPGLAGHDADGQLDLDDAPTCIAAAFEHLSAHPEVDERLVGMMGVCIGGGACLLAAAQPELAERVRFVYLVGPYLSLRSVLLAMSNRRVVGANGRSRTWTASEWAMSRQREWLMRTLKPDERARVGAAVDAAAAEPAGLSDQARAVFRLTSPRGSAEESEQLIDALDPRFLRMLEAASPCGHLDGLRAETLILHSAGDALIPVEQSRELVEALRRQVPLHYAELELFDHVDVSRSLRPMKLVSEMLRFTAHTRRLMRFTLGGAGDH